jgi:hypothetical protein
MMRAALVLGLLAALVAAPGAQAAAPAGRVVLTSCTTGLDPAARTATYEGRMRRVAGTSRMQMRFALQVRQNGAKRWAGVHGPGLGVWVTSDRGVARYSFSKGIENLAARATYRVAVRFRWLDARGRRLDTDAAVSKVCREPDLRPNLVAQHVDVQRIGDPARRRYAVTVGNVGATAAGAFDVSFGLASGALAPQRVVDLGPAVSTVVAFEGPRCQAGSTLQATVDPAGLVDESAEADNTLAVPCPQSAA